MAVNLADQLNGSVEDLLQHLSDIDSSPPQLQSASASSDESATSESDESATSDDSSSTEPFDLDDYERKVSRNDATFKVSPAVQKQAKEIANRTRALRSKSHRLEDCTHVRPKRGCASCQSQLQCDCGNILKLCSKCNHREPNKRHRYLKKGYLKDNKGIKHVIESPPE